MSDEHAEALPAAPLPWQTESWLSLGGLIDQDRLPHAIQLVGPEHIGKRHFQHALAQRLLCDTVVAGTACGQCRSCNLMAAGTHPDYLEVTALEDSRVIKVDQVRHLIDFAMRTASMGGRKVVLLGPTEIMNISASNALLKCLEEPPEGTHLLLFAHQVSAIPATVRSRCQTVSLPFPPRVDSLAWLESVTGSAAVAEELLALNRDCPLAARQMYLDDSMSLFKALEQGLDALREGRISALEFPALVEQLELEQVISLMQEYLERQLRGAVLDGARAQLREGFRLRDELARLRRTVINGGNPNRQLTIENCATGLTTVIGSA